MSASVVKFQSGRTILEMLSVLALAGVLSVVGIAGYSMAMDKYKTSALIDKVNVIAQQARVMYKRGNYINFSIPNLVAVNKLQDINNPFGGALLNSDTGDTQVFNIYTELFNVPTSACVAILRTNWGDKGTFRSITVNTSGDPVISNTFTQTPLAAGAAANACTSENQQIVWTLK